MTLRLLLVDDSTYFLRAARTLLEQEGVDVVAAASTSAEAIERARALRPDVMLVDIDLGEESGFDCARLLAEDAVAGTGRVLLISAYPEADLRELIDASPAVGFLPKSQLSTRAIRQLLGDGDGDDRGDVSGGQET